MSIIVKNSQQKSQGSTINEDKKDFIERVKSNNDFEDYSIKFITKKDDISKICIVGDMVMSNKEAIIKIFNIAYEENVTIFMISFSELAINLIVEKEKSINFMKRLHDELILDTNEK